MIQSTTNTNKYNKKIQMIVPNTTIKLNLVEIITKLSEPAIVLDNQSTHPTVIFSSITSTVYVSGFSNHHMIIKNNKTSLINLAEMIEGVKIEKERITQR